MDASATAHIDGDNSDLRRELTESTSLFKRFAQKSSQAVDKTFRAVDRSASRTRKAVGGIFTKLGTAGALLGIGAMLTGFAAARNEARATVSEIANFTQQISKVEALTGLDKTSEKLAEINSSARELGANTQFSATEAASGFAFLAQAGFDANESLASARNFLDLAAAGSIDLATSMDLASNIMSGFNLEAEQSARVSDSISATAASANTNVLQLAEALKKVAPVSASLGQSIEATSAAIGILGNAGIQGEAAGTALRNIMLRLVNPSSEVRKGLEALGIEFDQVNPAVRSITEIFDTFADAQERVADKTIFAASASNIFGLRAVASGNALTSQAGALRELTGEIEKADGTARRIATIQVDNLSGDFKTLKSRVADLRLELGELGLTNFLRGQAQGVTAFIDSFKASGNLEKFIGFVSDSRAIVSGLLASFGEGFGDSFSFGEVFGDTDFLVEIKQTIGEIFDVGKIGVREFARVFGSGFQQATSIVSTLSDSISRIFGTVTNGNGAQEFEEVFQGFADTAISGIETASEFLQGFIKDAEVSYRTLIQLIEDDSIGDLISKSFDFGIAVALNAWDSLVRFIDVTASNTFDAVRDYFVSSFESGFVTRAIKGIFDFSTTTAKAAAFKTVGFFVDGAAQIGAALSQAIAQAENALRNTLPQEVRDLLGFENDVNTNFDAQFESARLGSRNLLHLEDKIADAEDGVANALLNLADLAREDAKNKAKALPEALAADFEFRDTNGQEQLAAEIGNLIGEKQGKIAKEDKDFDTQRQQARREAEIDEFAKFFDLKPIENSGKDLKPSATDLSKASKNLDIASDKLGDDAKKPRGDNSDTLKKLQQSTGEEIRDAVKEIGSAGGRLASTIDKVSNSIDTGRDRADKRQKERDQARNDRKIEARKRREERSDFDKFSDSLFKRTDPDDFQKGISRDAPESQIDFRKFLDTTKAQQKERERIEKEALPAKDFFSDPRKQTEKDLLQDIINIDPLNFNPEQTDRQQQDEAFLQAIKDSDLNPFSKLPDTPTIENRKPESAVQAAQEDAKQSSAAAQRTSEMIAQNTEISKALQEKHIEVDQQTLKGLNKKPAPQGDKKNEKDTKTIFQKIASALKNIETHTKATHAVLDQRLPQFRIVA